MKGKFHTDETKRKISNSLLGRHLSDKTKRKISLKEKGKILSEETKDKISKSRIGKYSGKNSPSWKGGLSRLEKLEKKVNRKKSEQCEICGLIGNICFDHNHTTGKFRGWICVRCNIILGLAKDDIEILNLIIEYLKNDRK